MANDRNAGRKPKISEEQLKLARKRRADGESIASIAAEYGVSRQALDKRLRDADTKAEIRIDYLVDDELCSSIYYDKRREAVRVVNYVLQLSKTAFGYKTDPDLSDLQELLEENYLRYMGVDPVTGYLMSDDSADIDISAAVHTIGGQPDQRKSDLIVCETDQQSVPQFFFTKKDRVIQRTDTDGYQMKALTHDRRLFVKSQAVISGVLMRDWAVEVIASDICRQLSIPCTDQKQCQFVYEGRRFDGVYSRNFELDGYTFLSFERLLERNGLSSKDDEFIAMNSLDKLKWCADKLSEFGSLPYSDTLKYMIDLAVIDCLVGNIDRHTRNYGLFFNAGTGRYEIPPVFDNGMGLFENDPYRDKYDTFEAAMRNVYVSPYGEDPFDMIQMLDKEYDLRGMYPGIIDLHYPDILSTPYALEYERRILELWQK